MNRTLCAAVAATALFALGACGDGPVDGGAGESSTGAGEAARGAQLFAANCAHCHGEQAKGTTQGPPLADRVYEPSHHPDDAFRSAVANGVTPHHWQFGPMPPVPGVEPDEVEAIISYVRGLQREAGI